MFFSAVVVRPFVAELQSRGFGLSQALHALSVKPDDLTDVRNRISLEELNRIVARAMRASRDPALGLTMGATTPDTMLQMLGPLVLCSRSLRHAFALFHRYVPILAEGMSWTLVEQGETAMFVFRCCGDGIGPSSRFAAEYILANTMRVAAKLLPDRKVRPTRVLFQHARPEYGERYQDVFACPVLFDDALNALVCDRQLLDVPHPFADATLHDVLLDLAERTLAALHRPPQTLTARISLLLQHDIGAAALSVNALSAQLGLTTRQLRRRLALEGGTISDLVNDARRAHACAELRHGHSIQHVADQLGFAERSAFHRAFKRWTGQTPQQYSAEHRHHTLAGWDAAQAPLRRESSSGS
ncbi:MAG: AraC family transcriptional regulator [Polyangiales bacterium]